jgi:phosphatidylglycerol:prolipoprotein diacylglycerol transferase
MIDFWQNIYSQFDPVAFRLGSVAVHWYGIMYAFALLIAIAFANYLITKDKLKIDKNLFNDYVFWAEVGVILGARLGYIIFYDTHTSYYLMHPWQIFNPFVDGVFVGISGMSFHGAVIGFVLASILFCKKYKISFWFVGDIAAVSIPLGYIFGRIGNFLNQELFGRATDVPWGIYVGGVLRHPSQIYEAILEGLLVFLVLFWYRNKKRFEGELLILYGMLYSIARFISELFREPDIQLGYLVGNWLTMGMLISLILMLVSFVFLIYRLKKV